MMNPLKHFLKREKVTHDHYSHDATFASAATTLGAGLGRAAATLFRPPEKPKPTTQFIPNIAKPATDISAASVSFGERLSKPMGDVSVAGVAFGERLATSPKQSPLITIGKAVWGSPGTGGLSNVGATYGALARGEGVSAQIPKFDTAQAIRVGIPYQVRTPVSIQPTRFAGTITSLGETAATTKFKLPDAVSRPPTPELFRDSLTKINKPLPTLPETIGGFVGKKIYDMKPPRFPERLPSRPSVELPIARPGRKYRMEPLPGVPGQKYEMTPYQGD